MNTTAREIPRPRTLIFPSGPAVGLGHLSRSAALARSLSRKSHVQVFSSTDSETAKLNFLDGLETCDEGATDFQWDHVVLDLQSTMERHDMFWRFRDIAKGISVIADQEDQLPAELLVVPGPHAHALQAERIGARQSLLGPRYGLVDRAFRPRKTRRQRNAILIMLGSFSEADEIARLVRLCSKEVQVIHLVTTKPTSALSWVGSPRLISHVAPKPHHLAHLLASVEVAITSAGVGSLEALAVGTPLCVTSLTQTHVPIAASYAKLGLARDLGPIAEVDSAVIASSCAQLLRSHDEKLRMRATALGLKVWKGADRVADAIGSLL